MIPQIPYAAPEGANFEGLRNKLDRHPSISVIIPAYNEEKRLPKTLEAIDDYLRKQSYDYEILAVNDGSSDKTLEVLSNIKAQMSNIKIIDNKKNQGKGAVVRQGMLEAQGDYRLFTDADNSTSVDQIEKMWPEFKKGFDIRSRHTSNLGRSDSPSS